MREHVQLEERFVFPAVRKSDGEAARLADTLVAQHARRREIIAFVLDATRSLATKAMSKAQFDELGERFEEIERKQFGGDGFDIALDRVAKAEAALLLTDLAQFTAPAPSNEISR